MEESKQEMTLVCDGDSCTLVPVAQNESSPPETVQLGSSVPSETMQLDDQDLVRQNKELKL